MLWFSGLLAFVSLFAVFKAPARPLWFVAIAATEWGHWMALVSLVAALVSWRSESRWGTASWLAVGSALLFVSPLARAMQVARNLPEQLAAQFGPAALRDDAR